MSDESTLRTFVFQGDWKEHHIEVELTRDVVSGWMRSRNEGRARLYIDHQLVDRRAARFDDGGREKFALHGEIKAVAEEGDHRCSARSCGQVNPAGARFCARCGQPLGPQSKSRHAVEVNASIQTVPRDDGTVWIQTECDVSVAGRRIKMRSSGGDS